MRPKVLISLIAVGVMSVGWWITKDVVAPRLPEQKASSTENRTEDGRQMTALDAPADRAGVSEDPVAEPPIELVEVEPIAERTQNSGIVAAPNETMLIEGQGVSAPVANSLLVGEQMHQFVDGLTRNPSQHSTAQTARYSALLYGSEVVQQGLVHVEKMACGESLCAAVLASSDQMSLSRMTSSGLREVSERDPIYFFRYYDHVSSVGIQRRVIFSVDPQIRTVVERADRVEVFRVPPPAASDG